MSKSMWIGRTLGGRYKIEDRLGQGGMSAVYKATDPNLKRVVAIKMIHEHLSEDPDFVRRFESEASAVANLRHPNIVQVYDFNKDEGVYYMVLEFVPGETLEDRLKRLATGNRKLPVTDALQFTINICDAMGYAHQRGMVHRDIKPANIMLDVQGQAILMDFGIVKMLGGDSHTSTGAVVGTARYMSPEIIRGETADPRSDIYSLGVTLFEMLSGRLPFESDSAMTLMMMHLNDPVPDVREFRGDVRPEVVAILSKCLAKDRNERYQTAAELAADLKRAMTALSGGAASTQEKDPADPRLMATRVEPRSLARPPVQTPPAPASASAGSSQPAPSLQTMAAAPPPTPGKPARSRLSLWLIGGGIVGLLCIAAVALIGNALLNPGSLGQAGEPTQTVAVATNTSPATQALVVAATATSAPTEPPTETSIPLTPTPTTPYVVITGIRIENNTYVVDYEVHNFPDSPQLHVHMFFNTVPPEQAGAPGSGPWKLTWGRYGNPPFTQYRPSDRPANATQMCSLVANPNHSVQQGTGNCVDLPQ